MSKKFIPNGHRDFVTMAEAFARTIAEAPQRFAVSKEESGALTQVVAKYRAALQAASFGQRTAVSKETQRLARADAEQHVRRNANAIRASKSIDKISKMMLGIRERSSKPKQTTVPNEPPRLRFVRALHESAAMPMHELSFRSLDWNTKARPEGAVRLELFVDLIPPEEPIPAYPGANHGGRPWYLRSYTRSPVVLAPPMPRVPMRVVYWGRWADSTGNVGPFSATAAGWIESGSHQLLPGGIGVTRTGINVARKESPMLEDAREPVATTRERTYVVAVLEAQYQAINPQHVAPTLPAPGEEPDRERRQLEAPLSKDAAEAA